MTRKSTCADLCPRAWHQLPNPRVLRDRTTRRGPARNRGLEPRAALPFSRREKGWTRS